MEIEEKSKKEEWGAWKFVSDMLDTPRENGIYQTTICYEKIYDFIVEQKAKEVMRFMEQMQERANTTNPNLLLNEIVNYAYERQDELNK